MDGAAEGLVEAPVGRAPDVVRQRSENDCLLCAFAMLAGLTYEAALARARAISPAYDPQTMAATHSLVRRMGHDLGLALVSSLYMDWRFPGIVGVVSRTIDACGHALYWNGREMIDPGGTDLYYAAYVSAYAIEYTQRAGDIAAVVALDGTFLAAPAVVLHESF